MRLKVFHFAYRTFSIIRCIFSPQSNVISLRQFIGQKLLWEDHNFSNYPRRWHRHHSNHGGCNSWCLLWDRSHTQIVAGWLWSCGRCSEVCWTAPSTLCQWLSNIGRKWSNFKHIGAFILAPIAFFQYYFVSHKIKCLEPNHIMRTLRYMYVT